MFLHKEGECGMDKKLPSELGGEMGGGSKPPPYEKAGIVVRWKIQQRAGRASGPYIDDFGAYIGTRGCFKIKKGSPGGLPFLLS